MNENMCGDKTNSSQQIKCLILLMILRENLYKITRMGKNMRDLSPAGASLKSIGLLYESAGLSKLEIPKSDRDSMDKFMETNYEVFKEYAIKDSVIALYHHHREEQNRKIK